MRKVFSIVFFAVFFSVFPADAADADTVSVFSRVMNRDIKTVIIKPQGYGSGKRYPTLYLLHGYSDDYSGWVRKAPVVKRLSDLYEMIIVCPDGGYNSWYWDSPVVEGVRFETFVSDELVSWVDGNLSTIARREGRAITGLSMGGHGALYLAFRHQDVYGACGSLSGGVDIRPFPNNWDIARLLGLRSEYPERWERHTVMGLLHLLTPGGVKIILDCGTEDFFYDVNVRLHEALRSLNIPHDFVSRPGVHNWAYWENAIQYQALFFGNFFASGAGSGG